MENEDLTFPSKLINNFDFGDFISEFIEHKYSQLKKINNTVNNTNQISKWFYIQYKIVLIGQSFIGNKYTSQLFNKKYPNLKVYSIFKLLNEYCSEYKKLISEPEEESSRAKSKRKNQAELNKKQKEERLEELKPIIEIIKPYLELEENNNQTENNNSKSNNQNNIIPQDDVLLKLLIYQIEKDFPEKTKKELADEIKEISNKMNNILDKIEDIKNNFDENEKPKEKEKKGSKKDKEENIIENLERELSNLKEESIKGFIIIDFPNNLNQCYLLENYLTGYINEMERPKSLKDIEVKKISEIIDIKYQPKNEKIIKNSGIDFLINLSSKENDVNTLFTNIKYDPKLCALVYYFNEQLDDKFFYLYFSLMGQIDEVFFGSFFGHNNKNKSYSKKKDNSPKRIYFAIVKYVEEESLNILLDGKQAQTLINNYLLKTRNYKLDFQYDPLKDAENDIDGGDEEGEKKKNPDDDFVLVSGNTAKNNFSYNGVSFKIAKEKNKVDLELEEDEDENSDMPNFKKKKKKKSVGNDFYWNFQLLDKKRSVTEELQQLFAKDKEVIERKKKLNK